MGGQSRSARLPAQIKELLPFYSQKGSKHLMKFAEEPVDLCRPFRHGKLQFGSKNTKAKI